MPRMKKPRRDRRPPAICRGAPRRRAQNAAPRKVPHRQTAPAARSPPQGRSRRQGRRGRASAPRPAWRGGAPPSPRRAPRRMRLRALRRSPRSAIAARHRGSRQAARCPSPQGREGRGNRRAHCRGTRRAPESQAARRALRPALALRPLRPAVRARRPGFGEAGSAAIRRRRLSGGTFQRRAGNLQGRRKAGIVVGKQELAAVQLRDGRHQAQAEPGAGL